MVSAAAAPSIASMIPHLSWSKIQCYLQCSRRFAFKYIEAAPEERRCASLLFGGAIHRAIESIHEARLVGEPAPSIAALLDAYRQAWKDEVQQSPPLDFPKGGDAASLTELAGRMLATFLEHLKQDSSRRTVIGIEHEVKFRVIPNAPPMLSRIDLLELSEDGNDVIVTDFKTAKCSWGEGKVKEALPQLIVYSGAAVPTQRGLGARRIIPRFVVLTKGKKPKVQTLTPTATKADVIRLRETVAGVWSSIQQRSFIRREGWQCGGCPFRDRCLKAACGVGH